MPLLPSAPVRVQPYFGYRTESQLVISARALRAGKSVFGDRGRVQALRTMLAQFASHEVAGLSVALEYAYRDGEVVRVEAITDSEGFVHFDIPLKRKWPRAKDTTWDVVSLHWEVEGEPQRKAVDGFVLAPAADETLGVISDIDDTILETGITGGLMNLLRNLKRVIAHLPDERVAVPGADAFYNALGGALPVAPDNTDTGAVLPARKRPFFYVSSSPWNLFSYLVAFKRSRDLPLGPMMLRDWSLSRKTLGSEGHGDHKTDAIDRIINTYPELRFALVGDDTQKDFIAFGKTVEKHPGRIAGVFIRRASGEDLNADEHAAKRTIEDAGVPLWTGEDYSAGQAFLVETGLFADSDAKSVVKTAAHDES